MKYHACTVRNILRNAGICPRRTRTSILTNWSLLLLQSKRSSSVQSNGRSTFNRFFHAQLTAVSVFTQWPHLFHRLRKRIELPLIVGCRRRGNIYTQFLVVNHNLMIKKLYPVYSITNALSWNTIYFLLNADEKGEKMFQDEIDVELSSLVQFPHGKTWA